MTKTVLIFLCLVFVVTNSFSQTKYKYEYKFSLPTEIQIIQKDSVYAKQSLPEIYIIHSKQQLMNEEIDSIKECVKKNANEPNKCSNKKIFYITIEI